MRQQLPHDPLIYARMLAALAAGISVPIGDIDAAAEALVALLGSPELREAFPDGVVFVALAPIRDPPLVPIAIREASLALGVSRWRTTLSIVLPQTIGGIVTGATLAIARAAGETAPLLFTTSLVGTDIQTDPRNALASIPLTIFQYAESPDPADHRQAWAAALVLIVFVLVTGLTARALAARTRRRIAGAR